jgi:hypothetical protein
VRVGAVVVGVVGFGEGEVGAFDFGGGGVGGDFESVVVGFGGVGVVIVEGPGGVEGSRLEGEAPREEEGGERRGDAEWHASCRRRG